MLINGVRVDGGTDMSATQLANLVKSLLWMIHHKPIEQLFNIVLENSPYIFYFIKVRIILIFFYQ